MPFDSSSVQNFHSLLFLIGKWIEPAVGCKLYLKSYFPVYESNLVEVLNDFSLEDADVARDKNEG